jgi:hypothetical protein
MGKALKWLRSHKIKKVGWPVDQGTLLSIFDASVH